MVGAKSSCYEHIKWVHCGDHILNFRDHFRLKTSPEPQYGAQFKKFRNAVDLPILISHWKIGKDRPKLSMDNVSIGQWKRPWFETPSRSLWRHCSVASTITEQFAEIKLWYILRQTFGISHIIWMSSTFIFPWQPKYTQCLIWAVLW